MMSEPGHSVSEKTGAHPARKPPGLLDLSILVVDDVEDNLDLIEGLLEGEVWSVERAQSGEEAVRRASECRPDVILLDLMMPGMNGLAVMRAIRSNKALANTPVILQTAHADKDNIITARRLGCDSFLCKPLTKDRLLAELGKCLKSRPSGRVGDDEQDDDSAMSRKVEQLTTELADAKALLETSQVADEPNQSASVECFRNLIPDDSAIGQKLIRLANSPTYGGSSRTRTVTEAIIRIGVRETKSLIRKASSSTTQGVSTSSVLKALDLLDILAELFPDRTATPDGTLSLLAELNTAAESSRSEVAT